MFWSLECVVLSLSNERSELRSDLNWKTKKENKIWLVLLLQRCQSSLLTKRVGILWKGRKVIPLVPVTNEVKFRLACG